MFEGTTLDSPLPHQQQQQEQQHSAEGEKRDSFGQLFLSVDMEEETEGSSGDETVSQMSQVLGHRAPNKRKQEEAFMGSSPPQQGQAEETCQRSPKPKKEKYQPDKQAENERGPSQTSSPKPQRKAGREGSNLTSPPKASSPNSKREVVGKSNSNEEASNSPGAKNADVSDPSNAQHPSPMSRVHRLASPGWVRAASGSNPDMQHYEKSNCGCHACIKEMAVVKMLPTDRKGSFPAWFRDHVGERYIYSRTETNSHPKNCICKTHLEEEWEAKKRGFLKAPTPQPPVPKLTGKVSAVLKKLDPSRAGGLTRLPIPTTKTGRTSPPKQKPREPTVLSGTR